MKAISLKWKCVGDYENDPTEEELLIRLEERGYIPFNKVEGRNAFSRGGGERHVSYYFRNNGETPSQEELKEILEGMEFSLIMVREVSNLANLYFAEAGGNA